MNQSTPIKQSAIIHKASPEESMAFKRKYYLDKAHNAYKLDNANIKNGKLVIRMGL
jgi:hypothetical protein